MLNSSPRRPLFAAFAVFLLAAIAAATLIWHSAQHGRQEEGAGVLILAGDSVELVLEVALGLILSLLLAYLAKLLLEFRAHRVQLEALVAERTAEVRAREADLNYAQSIARVGSWVLDLATKELRGSAEAMRILGVSGSAPLSYKAFLRLVHPDDREAVERASRASLKGEPYDIEYRILAGADTRWVHSNAELTFDTDRTLCKALGTVQDITERKRHEEELQRLNEELERRVIERTQALEVANKELEAFSYSVSHDLRAPLRAIQGFSRLVEAQYASQIDEQGQDMLRRVGAGAQKMGLLIDDLLKLSRISRQAMRTEPIDLSALAREVVAELHAGEPERKVEWVIAPQAAAQGDPGLLRVVLQNLLGNAWKYSSRRDNARIEFGVAEKDGRPVYFVRDNGAGFDMAYASRLFGAFQRLHSTAEFPGSGIGLATVARILHRHGGKAWAEGHVDEGASFYFSLG